MKITAYSLFVVIGKLFGFIPLLNFTKECLVTKILREIYPDLIVVGIIFKVITSNGLTLIFFTIIDLFLLFALIIRTYSARKSWEEWMRLYEITNREMKINFGQCLELNWRTILFFLFVGLTPQLVRTIYMDDDITKGLEILCRYMKQFTRFVPIIFAKILVKGFKILNEQSHHLYDGKRFRSLVIETNVLLHNRLYKNLFQMSICYKNIFGWLIAGSLFEFLVYMGISLNFYGSFNFAEFNWAHFSLFTVTVLNSLVSNTYYFYSFLIYIFRHLVFRKVFLI